MPWETFLVGLCTGLFAATAIASSPSLSELVPIGVQVVLMAFRTGGHIAALANHLQKGPQLSDSWTYVVPGAGETVVTSMLAEFHKANVSGHRLYYRLYCLHFGNIQ
jgi:Starter unit:ACP transacylase in aflatoxin biosynthesis